MAIITSGIYRFNDVLDMPAGLNIIESASVAIEFEADNTRYSSINLSALSSDDFYMSYDSYIAYPNKEAGWQSDNSKLITIYEDVQVLPEAYDWFVENTYKITFRFKKINKSNVIKSSNGKGFKKLLV